MLPQYQHLIVGSPEFSIFSLFSEGRTLERGIILTFLICLTFADRESGLTQYFNSFIFMCYQRLLPLVFYLSIKGCLYVGLFSSNILDFIVLIPFDTTYLLLVFHLGEFHLFNIIQLIWIHRVELSKEPVH